MKRSSVSALILILAVACVLPLAMNRARAQNAAGATMAGKTAEQFYKNIQVMKGVPAESVLPAMQFISSSLGVECEFCHVRDANDPDANAKDDKKAKLTARKMIEMQMAINRDNFKGQTEITCYSCHRGAHDPVGVPVIAEEEPKRPEPERAQATPSTLPTADQILDKYVQAIGGADAVQKVSSRVESGTISFGGQQSSVEVLAKAPNKRITTVHTKNGDNITAFDGRAGWLGNPGGRPPRDMNAQEVDAISFDATFHLPTELKKMFAQFRVRPAEKIAGRDVIQLIGLREGKPPLRLFFDKESGLLLRTVRYGDTPLGRNPTQVDYTDYRSEGGVKIPFQWTVARPASRFTIKVNEAKQNVAIDDAKFAKPTEPAAPAEKKPPSQ